MRRWRSFPGPFIRFKSALHASPKYHWQLLLPGSPQRRLIICSSPIPATLYRHTGAFGTRDRGFHAILHALSCPYSVIVRIHVTNPKSYPRARPTPGTTCYTNDTPLLDSKHRARKGFIVRMHLVYTLPRQVPLNSSSQRLPVPQDDEVVYRIGCLCLVVLGSYLHLRPTSSASLSTPSYHPSLPCRPHLPRPRPSHQHHPSRAHRSCIFFED